VNAEDAERLLRAAGEAEDDDIDLALTALAFAVRGRPEAGDARYVEHLHDITRDVAAAARSADAPAGQLAALRHALIDVHGYHGDRDTYDDLRNADLAHVIDRRRGLPVALAILWLHAGRAQGWSLQGVNFPGHFLIQIDSAGERAILDPFNDGRRLEADALRQMVKAVAGEKAELNASHYAPASNRGILLRLQNNIKLRLLQQDDLAGALTVLDGMLMVGPRRAGLWREAGLLAAELENMRTAISHLETAAALAQEAATRQRIAAELAAIRGRLN
jgi:regulator of sirC expression with transglutaminase-like and TPR domain